MTIDFATGEIVEPMTDEELDALAECESDITDGVAMVGEALANIRDGRLYRAEFGTFEAYCQGRWGMARSTANRKIVAAEVAEILEPIGSKGGDDAQPTPIPESQARELAPLRNEPEVVRSIYADVQRETQGKPTASAIRQSVKRHLNPVPPAPVQDEKFWNDAAEKLTENGWVAQRDAERPYSLAIVRLEHIAKDLGGIGIEPTELAEHLPERLAASLPRIEAAAAWLNTFITASKESA